MIPKKNIKNLKLTPEQMAVYLDLEQKEKALKSALKRCGVNAGVIDKIVSITDLQKIPYDTEIIDGFIRETWGDFIT